ncbi:ABC transporter permease [Novosphingopyxis iocasae]|uniref:ABC transporter permease n=1 Tax=Novosphingopyxis iocasae TaxID=2762729 RepID=UPI0016513379|nr:ABC transporter permease [Novosphingopyxis iocasae]
MKALNWSAAWRLARRDLSASLRGLRLLFLCLFLGVATLAAIGSLTASITGALTDQGRELLGGDVEVEMSQRTANDEERSAFAQAGTVSETVRMRAMARAPEGGESVLTEFKGVDGRYPLYGTLTLADGSAAPALGDDKILIDQTLADRLNLRPGSRLRYGEADYTVRGIIGEEPDRVGEGFTLGPVAIGSLAGLQRAELIQPGSMYESKYRIRTRPGLAPDAVTERIESAFPSAGLDFRTRDRASPGAFRFFERMGQFLELIGLTALIIAGIGVGNGVASYLGGKRPGIATLKVLGARSGDIARIYGLQVGAVAAGAILLGLIVGAALVPLLAWMIGDLLPVRPELGLFALPLAKAAIFGALIAIVFTLPPLARARLLPAASLFRGVVERGRGGWRPGNWLARWPVLLAVIAIAALAVGTARDPLFAASVLGASALVLAILLAIGWAIAKIAARVPRPRNPLWRLALTNLHRPGSQTPALVVALGLALTLFVTLAAIQTSLNNEIASVVPERAPDYFVLDVPVDQESRFRQIVDEYAPNADLNIVPTLRGSITAYKGIRVADLKEIPEGAWFLRSERGLTYSDVLPEGSNLTSGQWWPKDYSGPPLISLDEEAAKTLGLKLGDPITVSILGREITFKLASTRKVNWDTMGFNYVMVVTPDTLKAAPHNVAATIAADRTDGLQRALVEAFPSSSIIPVGEVVGQITTLMRQMANAILAAASVAILAGIAVLVGAIAASRQARSYDSVILKTLGATRRQVLSAQGLEYAMLALALALLALALGGLGAWVVIVQLFEFSWRPDWGTVIAVLGGGALLTLGIGLAGSVPLMRVRPARALRAL